MATRAEKLAELQAELTLVKAQQASASAGGQGMTMGPFSIQNVQYENLRKRRIELEKSIQRLLRGGRGIVIDMSYTDGSDTMYRSGSELLP